MKYLPIHKAMLPHLKEGMVVHNLIRHRILGRVNNEFCLRSTDGKGFVQLADDAEMLSQFYISYESIRALRPFKGAAYIKKYNDLAITGVQLSRGVLRSTHAALKKEVDKKAAKLYLPMCEVLYVHLNKGHQVIHNGGRPNNRQGWHGVITDTVATHLYQSASDSGPAVTWDTCNYTSGYSKEWFIANMYIAISDIKTMRDGLSYVQQYQKYAKTQAELQAKQQPHYLKLQAKMLDELTALREQDKARAIGPLSTLFNLLSRNTTPGNIRALEDRMLATKLAEIEMQQKRLADELCKDPLKHYNEHKFSLNTEPTSWIAIDQHNNALEAATQGGLKAALALALAEHPTRVYRVFAQVGNAKAEPTLKFF